MPLNIEFKATTESLEAAEQKLQTLMLRFSSRRFSLPSFVCWQDSANE